MKSRVRVLLVDDHPLVRAGVRTLLAQSREFEVVGEAADGRQALRYARDLQPDVVLLDITMPGLNGIDAATRIGRLRPAPKVIVLSMHTGHAYLREALAAGANGYVLKNAPIEELERAIRRVVRGESFVSVGLPQQIADSLQDLRGPAMLTSRQREVLQLIAEGLSSRAIAERLNISLKTAQTHRMHIAQRLDIHDVAGLTRYAAREGLVAVEG